MAFANAGDVCTTQMTEVGQRWDAMGFEAPVKAVQYVVHGRNGVTISGSEATNLRRQLTLAKSYCRNGNEDLAAEKLGVVSKALANIHVPDNQDK